MTASALARVCARLGALVVAAAFGMAGAPAGAQGKLEARYTATLGPFTIGKGTWVIDIGRDSYTTAASGSADGLMRILASGDGTSAARGSVDRGRPVPGSFAATINSRRNSYDVRMSISAGNVKDLKAVPPFEPSPDRVPLTEAHRRGIVDPMTAVLMAVPGTGDVLSAEACRRKLPIFDGRQRFNLALSFKRMDSVHPDKGYRGPAVVCTAAYEPIAGHRPGRFVIRYLQETRDLELWLVPIAGTRVLVPFRVSIPTLFGTATLEATQFETEAHPPRPTPTKSSTNSATRAPRGL